MASEAPSSRLGYCVRLVQNRSKLSLLLYDASTVLSPSLRRRKFVVNRGGARAKRQYEIECSGAMLQCTDTVTFGSADNPKARA
jgi:hypothetical protein